MTAEPSAILPEGEFAIVEIMDHRTLIGRVSEVERFGVKLMAIEPVFKRQFLPAVMIGGASIYQFTPCTAQQAFDRCPENEWQLPETVRALLPVLELTDESGEFRPAFLRDDDD